MSGFMLKKAHVTADYITPWTGTFGGPIKRWNALSTTHFGRRLHNGKRNRRKMEQELKKMGPEDDQQRLQPPQPPAP
jgi:hypothetical protein